MMTLHQGMNSVGEALLLLPPRFLLEGRTFADSPGAYDLTCAHFPSGNKVYHLSGTNAEKGHCESLQYNVTSVKNMSHCFFFTVASLFYRVNVLAVGRDGAFI